MYKKNPASAGALLLSRGEVRELTGLGSGTLDQLLRDGEIDVVRVGRTVRIPKRSVLQWIDKKAGPWAEGMAQRSQRSKWDA